jgi:hypothetical protein
MSPIKAAAAVLLCCVSALVTGCSSSQFLSAADNSPILAAAMRGKVQGGRQAISGASVQLWAVGTSGYGSAANKLGSSVSSDANGSFSLGAYTCPTPGTLTYITASGGNPGAGANNPNIMLAAALGACSTLTPSTFIWMDEVSTAATAYALGQYFTPAVGGSSTADSFGAPNTTQAQTGIANAFATVNNLVCAVSTNPVCGNVATGNAVTSAVLPTGCTLPGTVTSPCVTVTPESAKLNTVADILAACVNTLGVADSVDTSCTVLFNGVVTTSGTLPTDTLQAAVYMSLNPTSNNANGSTTNLAALFGRVSAQSPYVAVAVQPTDWTVGIQYTDQTAATFLLSPQNIAADSTGNIWVVNGTAPASLIELTPTGSPTSSGISSTTFSGTSPRNLAIDTNNNVWVTTSSSAATVFEYTSGGATNTTTTSKSSYGIAIDGNNNVFVGMASTTDHYSLVEYPGGDMTKGAVFQTGSATPGTPGTNPTTAANVWVLPQYMAFDTTGNLWMTDGTGVTLSANQLVQLSHIDTSSCVGYGGTYPCPSGSISSTAAGLPTGPTTNTFTGFAPVTLGTPTGIAANSNGMWTANALSGNNTITNISNAGATGTNYGSSASIGSPRYVAVDGAGNVWAPNHGGSGTAISEFSSTGAILSPVNSGTAPFLTVGFAHPGLASCLQGAIDPSGNVWVANNTTTAGVFELVGAAAPTVTPIALALKNGTVGAKP